MKNTTRKYILSSIFLLISVFLLLKTYSTNNETIKFKSSTISSDITSSIPTNDSTALALIIISRKHCPLYLNDIHDYNNMLYGSNINKRLWILDDSTWSSQSKSRLEKLININIPIRFKNRSKFGYLSDFYLNNIIFLKSNRILHYEHLTPGTSRERKRQIINYINKQI